jgi:hypothetical protein
VAWYCKFQIRGVCIQDTMARYSQVAVPYMNLGKGYRWACPRELGEDAGWEAVRTLKLRCIRKRGVPSEVECRDSSSPAYFFELCMLYSLGENVRAEDVVELHLPRSTSFRCQARHLYSSHASPSLDFIKFLNAFLYCLRSE